MAGVIFTSSTSDKLMAAGTIAKISAEEHSIQKLAAFSNCCKNWIVPQGVGVYRLLRIQRLTCCNHVIGPACQFVKFIVEQYESVLVCVGHCSGCGFRETSRHTVVIALRPRPTYGETIRNHGSDRAPPFPHFSQHGDSIAHEVLGQPLRRWRGGAGIGR